MRRMHTCWPATQGRRHVAGLAAAKSDSEPGDAQAPHLEQDFEARGQLPCKEQGDDDVQADVQVPGSLVALLHPGDAGASKSPAYTNGRSREKVRTREELFGTEPGVEDTVDREENTTSQKERADLEVAVLKLALDQLAPSTGEFGNLGFDALHFAGWLMLVMLIILLGLFFGQGLTQVSNLRANYSRLAPLP